MFHNRPPRIGVALAQFKVQGESQSDNPVAGPKIDGARAGYSDIVRLAGGIPLGIPLTEDEDLAAEYLSMVDLLILTGGEDPCSWRYGAPDHPKSEGFFNPERDEWEFHLIDAAIRANKKILGICRGAELLAIYGGARLVQHIPDLGRTIEHDVDRADHTGKRWTEIAHRLSLADESHLFRELGISQVEINSLHHQGVLDFGSNRLGLTSVAETADGIIELFEGFSDGSEILGIQGHPEALIYDWVRSNGSGEHPGATWSAILTHFIRR